MLALFRVYQVIAGMKEHLLDVDVLDIEVVVGRREVGVAESNPPPILFRCVPISLKFTFIETHSMNIHQNFCPIPRNCNLGLFIEIGPNGTKQEFNIVKTLGIMAIFDEWDQMTTQYFR